MLGRAARKYSVMISRVNAPNTALSTTRPTPSMPPNSRWPRSPDVTYFWARSMTP